MGVMLPFDQIAEIRNQANETLAAEVPVHIEMAGGGAATRVGEAYDWVGEAHLSAAPHLVRQPNRHLLIDGTRYNVIQATTNDFVPHVELRLREMRGG